MGVIDLLARVERLINDGPAAQVFEFDLDTGLLRGALVMVIDTAEELSIDYDPWQGVEKRILEAYTCDEPCLEGREKRRNKMKKIIVLLLLAACVESIALAEIDIRSLGIQTWESYRKFDLYNMGIVPPIGATLRPSKIDHGPDQVARYIIFAGAQFGASYAGTGGKLSAPILLDTKTGRTWRYSAIVDEQDVGWLEMQRYEIEKPRKPERRW
jgi:hypothetical protein